VAFSVPALTFEGDLPASIFHMQLLKTDAEAWTADAEIVAVFHTNAGHVTLNDQALRAQCRDWKSLPHTDRRAARTWRSRPAVRRDCEGSQVGNADLLPGIDVNTDAMARMTQLVQDSAKPLLRKPG
jgi:hypothetical protein